MADELKIIWTRDRATVWSANLRQFDENDLFELLSDAEATRSLGYRDIDNRRRFVVRRGLLRRILSAVLDEEPAKILVATDMAGKPWLPEKEGHISLAFSEDEAVFGFSHRAPIGVDIERIDREFGFKGILLDQFGERERSEIAAMPQEQRQVAFFRAWARKEACAKAIGVGLKNPLSEYDLTGGRAENRRVETESATVVVSDLPAPLWHMAAVAVLVP